MRFHCYITHEKYGLKVCYLDAKRGHYDSALCAWVAQHSTTAQLDKKKAGPKPRPRRYSPLAISAMKAAFAFTNRSCIPAILTAS